ncbi:MAG: hypothetical protein FJ033_01485 [Chloroflexi bacterium]|nr:hypothetical protein [Chloroflexota bacterium]
MILGDPSLKTCSLPTPWDGGDTAARERSVLLIGPRAFYLLATTAESAVPVLYRADRFPTAIRDGWRELREMAGAATLGLAAVAQDATVFVLRSGPGFAVDWQPIGSAAVEASVQTGATSDLAPFTNRPAAGATVMREGIYVFGGRTTPRDVTRIPLERRSPNTPENLPAMTNGRVDAQALVHGNFIYLVGGNDDGKPAIERTRYPVSTDPARVVWDPLPAPPAEGGAIISAVVSRGKLWIVREEGQIQSMLLADIAPGNARGPLGSYDTTGLPRREGRQFHAGDALVLFGPGDARSRYGRPPSIPVLQHRRST